MIDFRFVIFISIIILLLIRRLIALFKKDLKIDRNAVFIVVLGDIGRSPRMNYHALSFANLGYKVTLIGYEENKLMREIQSNKNIQIAPLNTFPKHLHVGPQILQYGMKALYLSLGLLFVLLKQRISPKLVLVQNPPSVPTLAIVYLFSRFVSTKFVIDWHNYGFTILSLNKGENNMLVKICKIFEIFFGKKSDFNFCVTDAMKVNLSTYNINAVTLHDKAHERFKQLSIDEKNDFCERLIDQYDIHSLKASEGNLITELMYNEPKLRKERPVILVSSSSWTEDEDFHMLVEAFEIYQKKINEDKSNKPNIICLLTGKGPLKSYYENLFKEKNFQNIKIHFVWLEPSDYPTLLGCADLGLCFHKSSSNLDLPMKVVDMFGTRLPVCAYKFSCISELVKENENGLLFINGEELAEHILDLLSNLNEDSKLGKFRYNLNNFTNWNQEWNSVVSPILSNF